MKRIAKSQLELLLWAKSKPKGFTIDDAMAKFKSSRQSIGIRLTDARARGWLGRKEEEGARGSTRHRFMLTKTGLKTASMKWTGKGRFKTIEA